MPRDTDSPDANESSNQPPLTGQVISHGEPLHPADPSFLFADRGAQFDPGEEQAKDLWRQCCEVLRQELPKRDFEVWILPLQCYLHDDCLWMGAPNRYAVAQLRTELRERIRDLACEHSDGAIAQIRLRVGHVGDLRKEATEDAAPRRSMTRGRSSDSVVEQAQLDLFQLERRGQFATAPLNPGNEFPTLLTRLPIFVPGRAARQRRMLDRDNALPFETSWGGGRRFGPPLTVYDEDTLIALSRLRQNILIGPPAKMPYPVSRLYADREDPNVHVHVVICMLTDIQRMCGTARGGRNEKLRLASIRRLNATKIEFTTEKTSNKSVISSGTAIDLINVKWDEYEENAILYIQFSPIMATWLERTYTYIDWNVRRQLGNDVGKAVHRFLSGQPRQYAIYAKKLQGIIGYIGDYKAFMRELKIGLKELAGAGWLAHWEITGTGRSKPHKLTIGR